MAVVQILTKRAVGSRQVAPLFGRNYERIVHGTADVAQGINYLALFALMKLRKAVANTVSTKQPRLGSKHTIMRHLTPRDLL